MTTRGGGSARDHRAFEELAVGYALHALEPSDELAFSTHLAGCALCQSAVTGHLQTLGQLAQAVAPVEPPPSVLAGLRAHLDVPAADPAVSGSQPRGGDPGAEPVAGAQERGRDQPGAHQPGAHQPGSSEHPGAAVVDLAGRQKRVGVRRAWLVSAAAGVTALLVALAGYTVVLRGDRNEATQRSDRLAAAVRTLERPGAHTVRLTGFDGRLRVVAVATGNTMSLVVDGLTPNDPQSTYVLWGQTRSGTVTALSTFDVRAAGVDVVSGMPLSTPVTDLTTLMVTHEKGRIPPPQAREPVIAAGTV